MNKSDSIASLAAALAKSQAEMQNPVFDSVNPHFRNKYASLSAVRDAVTPVLSKNGLSVSQLFHPCEKVGFVAIETVLIHSSGEWISSLIEMPSEKPNAQGYGSAATYAKRYGLMAITGVVGDDDDDANHAVGSPAQPTPIGKPVTKENVASLPPRQQASPPKKEEQQAKREAPAPQKEEKPESVVCPACGTPGMLPPKGNNPYYRCYEKACEKKIHKDDWGKSQVDKSPEPQQSEPPVESHQEPPQEFLDEHDPNVPF